MCRGRRGCWFEFDPLLTTLEAVLSMPTNHRMPVADQDAIRYASESGFPLQIAVQHAIDGSVAQTGWSVRYVEHGWVHPQEEARGFIDLVIHSKRGSCIFVVECKRLRDATWVFMHYSGQAKDRRRAKPWVTRASWERVVEHGWTEAPLDPPCPETSFCAVRGQSASERNTLLERTGAELVLATEALAHAERDLRRMDTDSTRIYFPLIVTTANLKIADFDPASISLVDGELSSASIRDVPFIRFRKQLATRFEALTPAAGDQSGDLSFSKESSLFVVRADYLVDFLTQFESPTK